MNSHDATENLAKGHRIRLVFGVCLVRYIVTTVKFRMVLPSYSRQGNWKAYEFSELLGDGFETPVPPRYCSSSSGARCAKFRDRELALSSGDNSSLKNWNIYHSG